MLSLDKKKVNVRFNFEQTLELFYMHKIIQYEIYTFRTVDKVTDA